MVNYRTVPVKDLGKDSNIKVDLCEAEVDLYWKMAIEVIELIEENNKKGEPTVMIVPYGPYARLVYLVNKYRISLKNCSFINMDEYLDDNLEYLDKSDPLSFRGGMDRIFYSLVDEELLMPEEQRIFPAPGKEHEIWELIQKFGKLDMCWGGVGITGHIAFNEPPEADDPITAAQFGALGTRVLPISRETRTINAYGYQRGDIRGMPEYCITVGMKQILAARRVYIALNRDWQHGIAKHVFNDEVQAQIPASLLKTHSNVLFCAPESIGGGL